MRALNTALVVAAAMATCATAQAEIKVATVDVATIFKNYYKTHEAQAELDSARAVVQDELQKRALSIQAIEREIQAIKKKAEDPSLSEDDKKKLVADYQLKVNEGVSLEQERRSFVERRNKALSESMKARMTVIIEDIYKVVDGLSKNGNYDIILDRSALSAAQTKVFLFAKDNMEISAEVQKKVNADAPAGFDPSKAPTPTATPDGKID